MSRDSLDARVIEELRLSGSDIGKPHEIDFFLYLPTEASARRVAVTLAALGFGIELGSASGGELAWLVHAKRSMVPDAAALERIRAEFEALCAAEGGEYDGWGAEVVE